MALARDHHVEVPVQLNAHGLARFHGSQGNEGRERVTLHLLAAEPAPHAGRLDDNAVARRAQDLGDDGLDLRRMLRGGADEERALLPDLRPGRVRLQVEMLLAARAELTFQAVRGFREGFLAVAALQRMRVRQEALPGDSIFDSKDGRERLVIHFYKRGGGPAFLDRIADHEGYQMAMVEDFIRSEQGLVMP